MMANSKKEPQENLIDKLRFFLGLQVKRTQKDGLPAKSSFNLWYILFIVLLITLMQQFLLSPKAETIPYSQFKQYIAEGKVSTLTIDPENIKGTLTGKPATEFFISPKNNFLLNSKSS